MRKSFRRHSGGQLKVGATSHLQMFKHFIRYCLSINCLFVALSAAAQVQVTAQLDSNVAETGNPFIIRLFSPVQAGKPVQIDFSAWDTILPRQNILTQSTAISDGQQYQIDLSCITFDADTLVLPPLTIRLAGGQTAITNPLELVVIATPVPSDLNDMAPLKDVLHEPVWWSDYLPWLLVLAGLMALLLVAKWLQQRRQRPGSRSLELPPYDLARKKLEILARKRLWQVGEVKPYYAELTFILREYLQKRYQIPALESTTEETLAYLQEREFPQNLQQPLTETLLQADLVKFAKSMPPESFHAQALQQAQILVESTRQEPVPAEAH